MRALITETKSGVNNSC